MELTKDVKFILEKLNSHGYRGDIVGGPVRDFLLGKCPDDYDITTSATPEETKRVFEGYKTIDTGIKHGTVTLMLSGTPYEITTYRIDGEYKDSRHPETVSFTTLIEEDLSRRDFTMNAIAYNPCDGITDPFLGREDIEKRLIRTVGDPEKRFTEDALRILRGIRFAARLGFDIDEKTAEAMHSLKDLLLNVSAERIYTEWRKLLSGKYAMRVLSEFSDIIEVFLPEVSGVTLPEGDKLEKADYLTKLCALFVKGNKSSEDFLQAMKRLKTDNNTASVGKAAIDSFGKFDTSLEKGIAKLLYSVGEDSARLTVSTELLLGISSLESLSALEDYIKSAKPYKISHLDIKGGDVGKTGAKGKEIGEILEKLIIEVVDGNLENKKAALLLRGEEILRKNTKT